MNEEEELLLLQKKKAMEEIEEKVGLAKDPVALTSIREGLIDWEDGVEGDYPLLKEEWFTLLNDANELEWEKENQGSIDIIYPAGNGDIEGVRIGIENGADVNFMHLDGLTPLAAAAMQGETKIAHLLIENGANVNGPPDRIAPTPLDVAMDQGHADVCALLRKHGGVRELDLKFKHGLVDAKSYHNHGIRETLSVISRVSIHSDLKKILTKDQMQSLFHMAIDYFKNLSDGHTCHYKKKTTGNATGLRAIFKEKIDVTIFISLNGNQDGRDSNYDRRLHTIGMGYEERIKSNYVDLSIDYINKNLDENVLIAIDEFYNN